MELSEAFGGFLSSLGLPWAFLGNFELFQALWGSLGSLGFWPSGTLWASLGSLGLAWSLVKDFAFSTAIWGSPTEEGKTKHDKVRYSKPSKPLHDKNKQITTRRHVLGQDTTRPDPTPPDQARPDPTRHDDPRSFKTKPEHTRRRKTMPDDPIRYSIAPHDSEDNKRHQRTTDDTRGHALQYILDAMGVPHMPVCSVCSGLDIC